MKFSVVSVSQPRNLRCVYSQKRVGIIDERLTAQKNMSSVTFKSDKGAAVGVLTGAIVGLSTAALVIATGGLAAAVAAVGATGVVGASAGLGAQVGGIIGGIATKDED
jgi:basic membrane lipoprotein Med (substrate-binding protein (PBP1-ABC) superfamily)